MSSAQLTEQLETMVADAVRATGLELEALEVSSAGRRRLVRVVVDTPDGAPLDLDAVAVVSREVAAVLDGGTEDNAFSEAYTLEVSSPGLDRPLTLPRHWVRARLRLVRVTLAAGGELLARAGDVDGSAVTLLVDGATRSVPFTDIERAVVQVEFAEPPPAEIAALTAAVPPSDRPATDSPAAGKAAGDEPTLREESP